MIELRQASLAERLLLGETSTRLLALASSVPAAAAAWLLLAPGHLYSREMTWDLLFNLEGAWHIEHGHVPHVDFHEPLGMLGFALTNLGFRVVGYTPNAFLTGELMVLVAILAAAVPVAARRLAPAPALLFVVYEALLILLPANIGDAPNAYSFAMSYNRWGWAALALLCLLLFVGPRRGRDSRWDEVALAVMLWVFLFYLKITFAAGAIVALVAAMVVVGRVRQRWRCWTGVLGAITLAAAAPMNHAYLAEIWAYAAAGSVRVNLLHLVNIVIDNRSEYALYSAAIGLLLWLWQSGRAPSEAVASAIVLTGLGVGVLTQNAQKADIPLGIVICLLTYNTLAVTGRTSLPSAPRAPLPSGLTTILLVVLIWPLVSIGAAAKVFAGYYLAATSTDVMLAPPTSNLRGLAVPPLDRDVPNALARMGYEVLSSTRPSPIGDPLAQAEYFEALLEAAATLADRPQKVLVLDQVNVMPFVLGYPPPRGSVLWMGADAPRRSAEETFGDVDVVLVPKYSTYAPTTALALSTYEEYLRHHFPVRSETPRWTFLRRTTAPQRVDMFQHEDKSLTAK